MQWWMSADRKQREAQSSAGSVYATDLIEPVLPAIVSAHFEQDGIVLARRPDDGGAS